MATQEGQQKINGKHNGTPVALAQELSMPIKQEEKLDELIKTIGDFIVSRERQDAKRDLEREHEREIFVRIANSLDKKTGNGNNGKGIIAAVVGIVGVVLIVAAYIANIAGDKRALEIRVDNLNVENGKVWALEEGLRNRIDQLEKDRDVAKALNDLKKGGK